ncbi:methyl-accepting chemotaxis protein [Paraburkholderia sp. 22B1P]|uniref:methyl-accepting chemotaxis protein n=1 Tax=Paraburkholderia sp. 22B1P TaxID=3080498 RepID=UPI00308EB90F|nr:methyl-accepting chemotaxis protein [Paraburkholderia sp. 22B1P]
MLKTVKIRSLLSIVLFLLSVLLALVGIVGIYGIHSTNVALGNAADNVPTAIYVLAQQENIARARLQLDRLAAVHDETVVEFTLQSAQAYLAESDRAWSMYKTFPSGDDERRLAADLENARNDLRGNGLDPLIVAVKSSDVDTARSLAFEILPRLYRKFSDATVKLSQFQVRDASRLVAEGKSHERFTIFLMISSAGFGLLCSSVSWLVLRSAIARPLSAATRHFGEIEDGNLTNRIVVIRDDELGALMRSLERMQVGLRDTIKTIRAGAEGVAYAANEIASGNADLSKRTEEQAASLEETAASMEELTTTVKQNAYNIKQASSSAIKANETATLATDSVSRLSATMKDLKDQSGKIAEITSTIESIAFQTNILALNASVEAARAGEQGRGFAVVANEVRSLAQRSGTAAREIKELIDRSVGRVDAGAMQAVEAAQRMAEMLSAIEVVASLLNEISIASREQTLGIEQITTAVAHMDEVTQKNAALVEQVAAASISLREEAASMEGVVLRFRVKETSLTKGNWSDDGEMQEAQKLSPSV